MRAKTYAWAGAVADVGGYDAHLILEKNLEAARKVRDGKAVFERDSVCYN